MTLCARRLVLFAAAALACVARPVAAQEGSVAELRRLVRGLIVTPRVLVVGVGPSDDNGPLLAWLARGRMVQTGFLSLTRGESGPNFLGSDGGTSLGAVRTNEVLASRRVDGAEQYFTRVYDFGFARDTSEVFKRWPHDTILGEIVLIVRTFRPHVMVAATGDDEGLDGQHQALSVLIREAFSGAADTTRFPPRQYGLPWEPLKLYQPGPGLTIDATEFDALTGKTYAEIARDSRVARRTEGLDADALATVERISLQRVATRVDSQIAPKDEKSLFDGIDTSFHRFSNAPNTVADIIPRIVAAADSAQTLLDIERPDRVLAPLATLATAIETVRVNGPWCRHPSADAKQPVLLRTRCEAQWLDLDAAVDLVQRRTSDALLLAAGVSIDATGDRELIAEGDSGVATVVIHNRGRAPIALGGVDITGAPVSDAGPLTIPPDSVVRIVRRVSGLASPQPWWIGTGKQGFLFPSSPAAPNGLVSAGPLLSGLRVNGEQVPETIRRESDVTVSMTIAGASVTTSRGPLTFRYADPVVGAQNRTVASAPAVTLELDHALEWVAANKALDRPLRLAVKSYSDVPQSFGLEFLVPENIHIDRVPQITLAPHEQRNVMLRMHGRLPAGRYELGIRGLAASQAVGSQPTRYVTGFRTAEYSHLTPIRLFHSSGMYLQSVDIKLPQQFGVLYVKGAGDDLPSAIKEVGGSVFVVSAEDLLSVTLSQVTTIVLGRAAYDLHPELVAQNGRLMDFVRQGGTLVVLAGGSITTDGSVLPFPVTVRAAPARVMMADAPVTALEPKSPLLSWPNAIRDTDWTAWVNSRAFAVPAAADRRYTTVIETHDPKQPPNRNSILTTRMGKGTYVYTSLSFDQQIPAGVSGSLRLFINLLSASVPGKALP